ncbi:glyceraldehyde-3-phosphate dehydrogenase [Intrasporangium chromatireducens Q5-1]|uniref:Glyceraldehyde-3-phosphate dehydrogenase n=1 Tax=Intrasporangium chromatireducens Q5-1 TaxID=584657 RepID=W9GIR7_9MICO|nr:glyceraldehyde-3-phosphate dehydrogenase [Intrasporangium chromatireducens]EWT04713.1 glyceraldehyde-3-phosphate dehydrogenase [Intrasporangium chromatireducens Q5-1]
MSQTADEHYEDWSDRLALAEAMIPIIGRLYRHNNVVTSIYGRGLVNESAIHLIKAHRFARRVDDVELDLADTLPLLQAVAAADPGAASVDLARLNRKYRQEGGDRDLTQFVRDELGDLVGQKGARSAAELRGQDVVLYGFGRIGRLLARILVDHEGKGDGLKLRAVVVRKGSENDLHKRASLLRRDSVHGSFQGTITVDEQANTILANGTLIQVIYSDDPASVDYTAYGISDAIVVDNTGRWRDREGLAQHLACPGVSRVLLTAPGKGDLPNVVAGINESAIGDEPILSAASCTTNAIVPVLKAISDEYGILGGHVETVHSFTNDQNLIDNFHKGERRGRSAALNMVLTETGAAKAVAKALPELAGKLTGNSIRVPTPNVSMAILNLTLDQPVERDEVNRYLRMTSLHTPLHKQLDFIDSPEVVSTDFVGSQYAGIVDGRATITADNRVVLYVWYDNEFGYSCQVVRVLETMAGVHPPAFPKA